MFFHPKSKFKWNEGYFVSNEVFIEKALKSYEQGDYSKSVKIWSKFAPYGCPESCIGLSMAYWNGNGVSKNLQRSFYWLIRGTLRKQDPQLYLNLAIHFEVGEFIEKDPIRSIFCALIAKQLNDNLDKDIDKRCDELIAREKELLDDEQLETYNSLCYAMSKGFILNSEDIGIFRNITSNL